MPWTEQEKKINFRIARAAKIKEALAQKSWTQERLAKESGMDVRSVRNVLSAKSVQNQTILDICEALNIPAELDAPQAEIELSDPYYGSYTRPAYKHYEGYYFAYRRSFTYPGVFLRSLFEIAWDDQAEDALAFKEHQSYVSQENRQVDHSQSGHIHISSTTDLVHLVTIQDGALRLVTLTKMRGSSTKMRGAVFTQTERSAFHQPALSPIFLEKIGRPDLEADIKKVGLVSLGDEGYDYIEKEIAHVERDILFVATPPSRENTREAP